MASRSSRWSLADLFGLKKRQPPPPRTDTKYHSVSILPGVNACGAAHRFVGHRFLARQAPPLPLPTCDAFQCECRFRHHKDRRAGPRRRSDIGLMPGVYNGSERRGAGGRRREDHDS
ncbi:MAG: hypothetical protein ACREV5_10065 [Steroidobacter sp.]